MGDAASLCGEGSSGRSHGLPPGENHCRHPSPTTTSSSPTMSSVVAPPDAHLVLSDIEQAAVTRISVNFPALESISYICTLNSFPKHRTGLDTRYKHYQITRFSLSFKGR